MKEEWKDIEGWEGLYQISSQGRVKSLNYANTGKEKIIRGSLNTDGYVKIALFKNGRKIVTKSVHRMVYEAFIGKIPEGMQCNHINEKKDDNRLENLNLMTSKENINWGTGNERRSKKLKNGILSKPVLQMNKKTGEIIAVFPSAMEARRQLGVSLSHISDCCLKKRNTCGGYKWSFK